MAAGTENTSSCPANEKSISLALIYAINPLEKPNSSVIKAAPTAIFGSNLRAKINKGEKKTAPPTPLLIAIVAITILIRSKYQNSSVSSINSFQNNALYPLTLNSSTQTHILLQRTARYCLTEITP